VSAAPATGVYALALHGALPLEVGGGAGGGAVSTQILSQQSSQPYPIQPWQRPVGNTWQHSWSIGGGGKGVIDGGQSGIGGDVGGGAGL